MCLQRVMPTRLWLETLILGLVDASHGRGILHESCPNITGLGRAIQSGLPKEDRRLEVQNGLQKRTQNGSPRTALPEWA
jgi:hypothetical protein